MKASTATRLTRRPVPKRQTFGVSAESRNPPQSARHQAPACDIAHSSGQTPQQQPSVPYSTHPLSQMSHQADAKRLFDSRGYTGATIHNQNPVHLLEKPVRDRITESYYWKEQCFAVNEATLCDRAAALTFIGGTYGQQKPTPFLCLAMKLLQLMPERDIVLEYLRQEEFKYLSALAAFYIRLTFEAKEVYGILEPLLGDWRKLRRRTRDGGYALTYIDQFVDDLLTKDRVCGTSLRKLPQRTVLEDLGVLEVRDSALGEELEGLDDDEDEVVEVEVGVEVDGGEEEHMSTPERNGNGGVA